MFKRVGEYLFSPVSIAGDDADWIRARQLDAFRRFSPIAACANIANAILVAAVLMQTQRMWLGLFWAAAITAPNVLHLMAWRRHRHRPRGSAASPRALRRNLRDTVILALVWATFPILFYDSMAGSFQAAVTAVTVGMLCGGAFMLCTLPRSAMAWIGLLTLGALIALFRSPDPVELYVAGLLVVYSGVLVYSVRWFHTEFVRRLQGERLAQQQTDLIGLLLHDFEEAASDWLWRTDADGRIVSGLPRFDVEPALRSGDRVPGFLQLFEKGQAANELARRMAAEDSFSDHEIRLAGDGGVRWVSLAGKPRYENGRFAGYQGVASDITSARESAERVEYMATHDSLTGLGNRCTLMRALEECMDTQRGCSLLLLDLDRFKVINDTMGHAVGDRVLTVVADRLRHVVGRKGAVCRMGGDEFAIVVTEGCRDAPFLARQIVDAVELPITIEDAVLDCSTCVGIRHLGAGDSCAQVVMSQADIALYRAKASGHGNVVEFDRTMDVEAQELMRLERDLRSAVEDGQIHLLYQPLIDIDRARTTGCEALLRWTHPEHGPIPPDRFIEIAERCGLIVPIGEWVIRSVVAAAARIDPDVRVAVNVSPVQLRNPNLPAVFTEALTVHGVDPARIEVEITESVLLADTDANLSVLQSLRELGLKISLDDFGTGYSSFSYLRKFAFDKLKIDRSFVEPLDREPQSISIVGSINALAKALKMTTVAEGVETERQFEAVRIIGCDQAQGYLFARPLTLDALVDYIDAECSGEVQRTGTSP
ncbi:MAG: EAL domain-containing protein [Pseudomonadota bacterium]|nr:EAL domain-containing protein [Pseudomonadota bacterium]